MGWGQKNSRFFMQVNKSSRMRPETILGSAETGLQTVMAGEKGCLRIYLYTRGEEDKFEIWFEPWRKSEKRGDIILMHGLLDFDKHEAGNISMRINNQLLEALSMIRAREIMAKGTQAEGHTT